MVRLGLCLIPEGGTIFFVEFGGDELWESGILKRTLRLCVVIPRESGDRVFF